jgi:hypothetical protein
MVRLFLVFYIMLLVVPAVNVFIQVQDYWGKIAANSLFNDEKVRSVKKGIK